MPALGAVRTPGTLSSPLSWHKLPSLLMCRASLCHMVSSRWYKWSASIRGRLERDGGASTGSRTAALPASIKLLVGRARESELWATLGLSTG